MKIYENKMLNQKFFKYLLKKKHNKFNETAETSISEKKQKIFPALKIKKIRFCF